MLNTVRKVGPVLDLFTPEHPEWRMTDIAKALGMPKSSTHALVSTLAEIGLLSIGSQGRYRLGWRLLTLSERMRASLDFREVAMPVMTALAAALRETVLLSVLDGDEVLYVERAEGSHPTVRLAGVRVGGRLPLHCSASGKILLADRDPAEVRAIVERAGLRPLTQRSHRGFDELDADLGRVRARGYATDDGEIVVDVCCLAVPVHDRYGAVLAAMSVSVPKYRFAATRDAVLDALSRAGEDVSERLREADPARPEVLGARA
jgi:DNA-binding IclR family transcriptional regulator